MINWPSRVWYPTQWSLDGKPTGWAGRPVAANDRKRRRIVEQRLNDHRPEQEISAEEKSIAHRAALDSIEQEAAA